MSYKQICNGERGRLTETYRNEPTGYANLGAAAPPSDSEYYEYQQFLDELEAIRRKYTVADTPTPTPTDTIMTGPVPSTPSAPVVSSLTAACKSATGVASAAAILRTLPPLERVKAASTALQQGANLACLRDATRLVAKEDRDKEVNQMLMFGAGALVVGWLLLRKK